MAARTASNRGPSSTGFNQGLDSTEAQRRLEKFGLNEFTQKREFAGLKLLLNQFKSPLIYILILAGSVTFFLRDFADTTVILAAVFLNTTLGYFQENKAQRALAALSGYLSPKVMVIRDGKRQEIEAAALVPGDLVILTIGDRVPADGVLVEADSLSVNEAILTGESLPVGKKAVKSFKPVRFSILSEVNDKVNGTADKGKGLRGEKANQVFMGTMVVTGIGKMVVAVTGGATRMGKIGRSLGAVEEEKTPLQVQLDSLAKVLAAVVGLITLLIFLGGWLRGYDPLVIFTTSVAVAVAAIPEGLVVTLTVILALGMQKIFRQKALVRKLLAAETLGSVSVICADKTGTLTEGEMRVVKAVTTPGEKSKTENEMSGKTIEAYLVKAAVLCNDLRDPLEAGMLDWAKDRLASRQSFNRLKRAYPRLDEIPFSPDYKYIATLHESRKTGEQEGGRIVFLSGAPEVVLARCQMSEVQSQSWIKEFENLGQRGYRLVGFAYQEGPKVSKGEKIEKTDLKGLDWLGVLVYEDPVRKNVRSALEACRRAGIKVKVITGDYLATASSVLGKLGLIDGPSTSGAGTQSGQRYHNNETRLQKAVTGDELEKMSDGELASKIEEIVLFARTSPEQKLRIVNALKAKGEVVAMTGDGVNDAPAIKAADIGIVVSGASDVSKQTADMVLLDSNFQTIVGAVEGGRMIFENIKKVVLYLLSDSFMEVALVGGTLLLGLPLPVTAAQILWVNLAEDALPGMSLAFEKNEGGLMNEPPRPKGKAILNRQLAMAVLLLGVVTSAVMLGLYVIFAEGYGRVTHLQTLIFLSLGANSLFNVYACRSLHKPFFRYKFWNNRQLNLAVLTGFFLLALAVYFPPLSRLLQTQPLDPREWGLIISIGVFNFLLVEGAKWGVLGRSSSGSN